MAIYMTSSPRLVVLWFQGSNPAMASLRCYSSNPIIIPRKSSLKTLIRASMDSCSSSESKKASNSVSFTNKVNKFSFQVYEDKNMGILCYADENGELICEGLDEGPRLTWQDMEKLNKEKKLKTAEDPRERTLWIAGGIDWSSLQTAGEELKKEADKLSPVD